jgi:hypothetical protein
VSEHDEQMVLLREIRDGIRALVNAAAATAINANPEELLSLIEVDRLLGKANGYASKEIAAGRLGCVNPGAKRPRVARWQVRTWQERFDDSPRRVA